MNVRQNKTKAGHSSLDGQELDGRSLAAIRSVLKEEHDQRPSAATASAGKPMDRVNHAAVPEAQSTSALDPIKAQIFGYRPSKQHIVLAVLVLLLLFRPWVLFWGAVFGVFALIGLFLIFGYDGFWHRVMNIGRWYAKRNPDRAGEMNRKLDAFAMKWDMFLDHFPDGTVDGLYMPDFSELATAESRHDEALDRRFANLHES